MELTLNRAAMQVELSGIRQFTYMVRDTPGACALTIGEPDLNTPEAIKEAAKAALDDNDTHYPPGNGYPYTLEAISKFEAEQHGLHYSPDEILLTVGATEALFTAFQTICNPGDEVIIPVPSFVCYGPIVTMSCGKPVYVETKAENEFRLTAEELKAAITPKTKLLVLPFPNNPTGGIMEREDLEAIAEVLRGTDIMILSDEIYSELSYGVHHVSPANIPELYERTLVVNGFSKAYAMTGWRLGYVCGPKPLLSQMVKIHQYGIMSAPTTSQYAAIEALKNGDEDIETMRKSYDSRRKLMLKRLREIGLECFEPKGAFYMFPSIKSTGPTSDEFCTRFLKEEKVAVIPGTAFGDCGEGYVRRCYAVSVENIEKAMSRMGDFIKRLK